MKDPTPYKCDYCDARKGVSNHWWLRIMPDEMLHRATDTGEVLTRNRGTFVLDRWLDAVADREGVEHICSESCAAKALSKWLSAQSANAAKPQPVEIPEKSTDAK